MPEARALVFPSAIALGARPLDVPGRGNVLAVSAFYAFRLSDGGHVMPAQWYETVATGAGATVTPDSMAPLPGAELLVLGTVPPVAERTRAVTLRCGTLLREFVLRQDPDQPEAPFTPDATAAAWHDEHNPEGRGGPDDDRRPLIVRAHFPEVPTWLGPTPFDHPLRLAQVGTPDAASGTGWPSDADPAVFYEAHPMFWSDGFQPGDPLRFEGLGSAPVDTRLPPYRITITSGHEEGRFVHEIARIHGVTLIPSADLGAMFWRVAIDVGEDILAENIQALVAALEDADSPRKDPEHWGQIAVDRWLNPDTAFDDRPLLPPALAATVTLPFAMADDDPMKARHAATEDWMKDEVGMGETNPFGKLAPESQTDLVDQTISEAEKDDAPPNANDVGVMADTALAAARQRHADAGFKERDPDEAAAPETRGTGLDAEIKRRLSAPYQSPRERQVVAALSAHEVGMDADDVMDKLAGARQMNPDAPASWPAMVEDEGARFGDALYDQLRDRNPPRHLDVSGAMIGAGIAGADPGEGDPRRIADRRFDGFFAEDTTWESVEFARCEFEKSSFCRAKFKACTFIDCEFRDTNLSKAEIVESRFETCTFAALRAIEPTWFENTFERCAFEEVSLSDVAMRDTVFDGGTWTKVDIADGLLMDMTFRGMTMTEVTLAEVMFPQNRFERVAMTKVWVMGKGPAASVFEEVEADTCGFLGYVRFDQAKFNRVRFAMTGFTNAVFADAEFSENCQFDRCDFSSAIFANVTMPGMRFIECSMTGTQWANVQAPDSWFYGALLRGVDFGDTNLARAVFTDADLEGTKFLPDKTIGADFRGTVRDDA